MRTSLPWRAAPLAILWLCADSAAGADLQAESAHTGTRIAAPQYRGSIPVHIVGADSIKLSGATRIEDFLNTLPMVLGDLGAYQSAGATGTASVNLHMLGAQRTVVLVNGHRLFSGDPTRLANASADLNQIPVALIERIEVLTGSAATLYGEDAVGGVVNFIMKNELQGAQLNVQYSSFLHHQHNSERPRFLYSGYDVATDDAENVDSLDAALLLGQDFADHAGHVNIYADYHASSAIDQVARDFGICPLQAGKDTNCASSSTWVPGRFFGNNGGDYTLGANNALIDYLPVATLSTGYLLRPDKRFSAGVSGDYVFNAATQLYGELSLMQDRTTTRNEPSGAFLGDGPGNGAWNINCNNPYLPTAQASAFCTSSSVDASGNTGVLFGRRNLEAGAQFDELQHRSLRSVFGARGEWQPGWRYDVYGAYATTRLRDQHRNDVSRSRLSNALQAVTDPVTGQVVCRANAGNANGTPGCAPYNVFQLGQVTPAALAYIAASGTQRGATSNWILSGELQGDMQSVDLRSPWASDAISVAFGSEFRSQQVSLNVDPVFASGDLAGLRGSTASMSGSLRSWELFAEFHLPVLQDKWLAKELTLDASTRFAHHSTGPATNAYRAGLVWSPLRDVQLRGAFEQSERAPNAQELFAAPLLQTDFMNDPCGGATPVASLAACARSGVTVAQYGQIRVNPDNQYRRLLTGNVGLIPEAVSTRTFGLLFTPRFLPRLSLAFDYFSVKITRAIGALDPGYSLSRCVATGESDYCDLIHRAPGSGSLWLGSGYIESGTDNLGSINTSGANISLSYQQPLGWWGDIKLDLLETNIRSHEIQRTANAPDYDCAGLFGSVCGVQLPRFRYTARSTWTTPMRALAVSIQMRHISSLQLDRDLFPQLGGSVYAIEKGTTVRNYMDVSASYALTDKIDLLVGVNNLEDIDPPLLPAASLDGTRNLVAVLNNANTYPQIYDTLGRNLFVSLSAAF